MLFRSIGADTINGGAGTDTYLFLQGDSPILGTRSGTSGSFQWLLPNGVDVIQGMTVGESISLAGGIAFNTNTDPSTTGNQQYALVQGTYVAGSSFTQGNSVSNTDTLVLWDADPTAGFAASAIVLQGVATVTQHNTGQIIL